jgi:tetratricopeptide (TPR) repeat protein
MSKDNKQESQLNTDASAAIQEKLNQGRDCYLQGALPQAEKHCQEVLAQSPNHVDALNLLGLIVWQTKGAQRGIELFDKAIALKPDHAKAHCNRGLILAVLRRLEEALASYDKAIALKPDFADAHNNRGVALNDLKRFEEALASYDKAIALKPEYAEAYSNRGLALNNLQRLEGALASYDKAIALKPDFAEAHSNRGVALNDLKRFEEALASYDKAIALKPEYAEAYSNRGLALNNLQRFEEALASCDKAIALKPDFAEAHCNRGLALNDLQRFEEALASCDKAIALRPDFAEAYNNRGLALNDLQRFEEALASYDKAIALKPDYAEAHWNKSLCLLLGRRFEQGWRLYEWRKKNPQYVKHFAARSYSQPLWLGEEPIVGKTLFVYWEQGLGDTIQFCRFAKLAEHIGANVVFSAQNCLHGLLKTLSPSITLVKETEAPPNFDYHCPLMSLPLAFKTALESIPTDTPYLCAEPKRIEKWKQKLGDAGFKVGIAWQGSKTKIDIGRSFALTEFFAISQIPNVRLICLQKNEGVKQLNKLPEGMNIESLGEEYDAGADAFLDAAAVMENLDLIITSDTAIAHLAGALGRPVWVALKHVPDWRWLLDRRDSPWYPTMRLFRQPTRDDWKGVFSDIANELITLVCAKPSHSTPIYTAMNFNWLAGSFGASYSTMIYPTMDFKKTPTPRAPISWGELIDKITILEIKSVKLLNEMALANVRKELSLLLDIAGAQVRGSEVLGLKKKLRAVNEALWEIEDSIREKESANEFDQDFITLARSVYRRNDERASIKRQLNVLFASEIVEEKSYKNY